MVCSVRSQPIEFSELDVPLSEQLAMRSSQLPESNLPADKELAHVVFEHSRVPVEDSAEVLKPQIIADVWQIAFENTANQWGQENVHLSPSQDKTQPELILDETRQGLVEPVQRVPRLTANSEYRRNTPRVRKDRDWRDSSWRPDHLTGPVSGSIGNRWGNGGHGLITKCVF